MQLLKNPIILALDVDNREQALHLVKTISSKIGAIKIGPRLVNKYGADFVTELSRLAPVFVDNKYFDIPSTMVAAVKQCFEAGATLVTVHALAGLEAMTALYNLEKELNRIRPFKILAVTILTSWDKNTIPPNFQSWSIDDHVRSLVEQVCDTGLSGVVCSAHELTTIKNVNVFKVTPGIRLEKTDDDQKRVMIPKDAIQAGASALVIGRPIIQATDPVALIEKILFELQT